MSPAEAHNANANSNNMILTIKDTKLYFLVIILSAKDNQKLSKSLSKGFESSFYWNGYKTKSANKNRVNRLFILVYLNQDDNVKTFKTHITYQKALLIIIASSSVEQTFKTNQLILI